MPEEMSAAAAHTHPHEAASGTYEEEITQKQDVMKRKPAKPGKGVFSKGMTWRIIYQGVMIGI